MFPQAHRKLPPNMQIKSAVFKMGAINLESCPDWQEPEFAFIGRSNVGKSSLVNMLTNKDALAKVSATPGKTRELNFFLINEKWSLVDLPGYGYAKVARSEKGKFTQAVADYISQRHNLRRVFTLIDSRLPPQQIDLDFIEWITSLGVPYTIVFTKSDKQSPAKTQTNVENFLDALDQLQITAPDQIISSSKKRDGRVAILKTIEAGLGS